MERKVKSKITGYRAIDGAGVNLVRVLGRDTVEEFDPILMLDSFDSTNPNDYTAGFPTHPHRGIETISYIYSGQMTHKDSLGNEDTINSGEVQWMTAGSGILHSETLPESDRLLGVQLWLNLPSENKMCPPAYQAIKNTEIKEIEIQGGILRLLAGKYLDHKGYQSKYLPLDYYDIHLTASSKIKIKTENDDSVMLFTLIGEIKVGSEEIKEKTAVKLTEGTFVEIEALSAAQVLFISSKKLSKPVFWGGPIVMSSEEDLYQAFMDLETGSFLQDKIDYEGEL